MAEMLLKTLLRAKPSSDDAALPYVQGQALGTSQPTTQQTMSRPAANRDEDLPKPLVDKNLTEEDRAKLRADRAAAAEARLKQQNPTKSKGKKKASSGEPLRGPNTQNTMTWTV